MLEIENLGSSKLGKYTLLRELGRSGGGVVCLAEDEQRQRRVAIKMLNPTIACKNTFLQRFRVEARAIATISHPISETTAGKYRIKGHWGSYADTSGTQLSGDTLHRTADTFSASVWKNRYKEQENILEYARSLVNRVEYAFFSIGLYFIFYSPQRHRESFSPCLCRKYWVVGEAWRLNCPILTKSEALEELRYAWGFPVVRMLQQGAILKFTANTPPQQPRELLK